MSVSHPLPHRIEHQIRAAVAEDAPGIAAIHIRSWLATYPDLEKTRRSAETGLSKRIALWTRRLSDPGLSTLVAVGSEGVLGFVHLGPSPDPDDDPESTGQVLAIHVDPDLVGGGIGGLLMSHAIDSLRGSGYRDATLWVVTWNLRARTFYERLGWRLDGAARRETLAVEAEEGDEVEVVRYRLPLAPVTEREP